MLADFLVLEDEETCRQQALRLMVTHENAEPPIYLEDTSQIKL